MNSSVMTCRVAQKRPQLAARSANGDRLLQPPLAALTKSLAVAVFLTVIVVASLPMVSGHARLIEPPARNTLWRFGYRAPPNFEDSELFCGGIKVQWADNGGKCGVCGDSFSDPRPRRYESGSPLDPGLTVRSYAPGEQIDLVVDVVANHLGFFEFALCPRNDSRQPEDEDCFQRLKLSSVNATDTLVEDGDLRYRLKTVRKGIYQLAAQLPAGVTCSHCVLRWHWRSANNWGRCADGRHHGRGCGPQETYRNCADIAVARGAMGVRGLRGANVRPPKRYVPPSAEQELQMARRYHDSENGRFTMEGLAYGSYYSGYDNEIPEEHEHPSSTESTAASHTTSSHDQH